MKKMLMVASVPSMIGQFNMSNIAILQKSGYKVDVACNFEDRSVWTEERIEGFKEELDNIDVKYYQIDFARNPIDICSDIAAYKNLVKLIRENKYTCIHCHTPTASAIARLAAHRTKTKVIYTAHGFHFYSGAPLKNWLIFYPIEKLLARYTDILITINREDYERAKRFKAKKVEYVPGVGIDTEKIRDIEIDREKKREELGILADAKVILSVGELNDNKNHSTVISAIAGIKDNNVYYVICGQGNKKNELNELVKSKKLDSRVILTGYRTDVLELYKMADIYAFPSIREGLSVALMEAMSSGLPIVCSKIRGNVDLIEDKSGGYLVKSTDVDGYRKAITELLEKNDLRECMSKTNLVRSTRYDIKKINRAMQRIYDKELVE